MDRMGADCRWLGARKRLEAQQPHVAELAQVYTNRVAALPRSTAKQVISRTLESLMVIYL